MAGEFRKKGSNIALGPVVGPVGRIAVDGRYWEGFALDPYLSGQLAYETVAGVQSQGIITSVKVCSASCSKNDAQAFCSRWLTCCDSIILGMNKRHTAIRMVMCPRCLPI